MAKFPIKEARQTLGFTPTTAVRANIDTRTGEGQVGAAIGQGLLQLGEQFQLINAKTQLSESDVAAAEATNRYFLELQGNDEPETYGTSMNSLFDELGTLAPRDRRAKAVYNRRTSNLMLSIAQKTRAAAKAKLKSKAQTADFLLLQKAKENGDFIKYKASVINNTKLEVYDAKAAETLLDNADKERDIKDKNDVLGLALTQRDIEGVIDVKEAKKTIDASVDLTTSEKIDLNNQVTNQSNQEKIQRDNEFANRMGNSAENFGTSLADNTLTEQQINDVDLGGIGDQKNREESFKEKWRKIFRDTMTRSEPLVSDESVYDALVVGNGLVERGTKQPSEWETEFAEANANGKLEREDRRNLRSKDIIATKSMQNRTFTDAKTTTLRPRLVQARQGELAGLIEVREIALSDKDFKAADALNFNIKKAQAQEWNFGQAYRELRSQISQNPEWSQKQIFVASDIVAEDFDKDLDVLLRNFDEANPNQSILKTPPDREFEDIWQSLSQEDKSIIWSERMAGTSVRELLDSEEVAEAQK